MDQTGSSIPDRDQAWRDRTHAPFTRRKFLTAAGGGAAALAAAPALAACSGGPTTAPTTSGKGSLKLLLWSHFVPAFDTYFAKYAKDWGSKNHVNVTIDHVQTQTVVTHFSSEVAAGTGHDLVQLQADTQPAIFAPHLADVTDLHNKIGSANGGWIPLAQFGNVNGKWITIPEFFIEYPGIYRKDLFDSIGAPAPATFNDLITYGAELKKKGHPIGVGFMNSEILSWNDSSNNTYLDSGVGSFILNPISAYRSAPQSLQNKCHFVPPPAGARKGANTVTIQTWVIPKWSKVQDTAKKFLSDYFAQYPTAFKASTGYDMPMLTNFLKKPMPILAQGKYQILQDAATWSHGTGWPGPPTHQAGLVNDKYLIAGVFAKYVTGQMNLKDAVNYGVQQLKSIYG
jgi:multiple sugar transport system substrate-binding protein